MIQLNGKRNVGMNGKEALFDSNIIIYLSKGVLNIENFYNLYNKFYISIITYMEVLGYKFKKKSDEIIVKNLLKWFEIVNIDLQIANIVIDFRKKNKIRLPDAIILATAKYTDCKLITTNVKDFQSIDNKIEIINPL